MPETFPSPKSGSKSGSSGSLTIAGKKYPKSAVYAGAAAVAGIVIYAWWSKSSSSEEEVEPEFDQFGNPIAGPTPGLAGPTVVDSNLEAIPDGLPRNNADWGQKATEYLTNQGYEGTVVAPALGKFIARKPLTAAEQAIVRAAIAGVGYPPNDGPWTVIEESAPIAVGLTAPKNLRVTGTTSSTISVAWDAVVGATAYEVVEIQGASAVRRRATVTTNSYTAGNLQPNNPYRITVYAKTASKLGDPSSVVGRTTGVSKITQAPTVTVVKVTRTSIHFRWNAVPGASGYILSGRGLSTRLVPHREFVWQGLKPNSLHRLYVQGAQSKANIGPKGSTVGRTSS